MTLSSERGVWQIVLNVYLGCTWPKPENFGYNLQDRSSLKLMHELTWTFFTVLSKISPVPDSQTDVVDAGLLEYLVDLLLVVAGNVLSVDLQNLWSLSWISMHQNYMWLPGGSGRRTLGRPWPRGWPWSPRPQRRPCRWT